MFEYLGGMTHLTPILDQLIDAESPDDDPAGRAAFTELDTLRLIRNVIDHRIAVRTAQLNRLGVAKRNHSTLRKLLIEMGFAPAVASRVLRAADGLSDLHRLSAHAADGRMSAEIVDAVVRGVDHIEKRSPTSLSDVDRAIYESELITQVLSGATPAEVLRRARTLGNIVAEADGGIPAADDRRLNAVVHNVTDDGRVEIAADLTNVIGEKFIAMIDDRSVPRPEPDGANDRRSPEQRRADALELILDQACLGATIQTAGAPRTQLILTIPADTTDLSTLPWTGTVTDATARALTCDGTLTEVVVDAATVPLDMGREKRVYPAELRKAVVIRDACCIKCGAPPSHTQVHHIQHWADGGTTSLDNGCLLCQRCHTQVHHHGWDVAIGVDRHPWLIPPIEVDPRRRPLPAYNRRTMRLDDAAA
ncbi:HNH endonuclease signature motif containing protein [Gordonia sp. 'Campus']|uniref:HNH endonuclease n=1 Tax=Gordonia sp. 'Campus' TaxID=2915824 RepID=UPI001EE4C054|nr:HNH endonuclease signature motif containing protein [Gordonia sp. 'Campus']